MRAYINMMVKKRCSIMSVTSVASSWVRWSPTFIDARQMPPSSAFFGQLYLKKKKINYIFILVNSNFWRRPVARGERGRKQETLLELAWLGKTNNPGLWDGSSKHKTTSPWFSPACRCSSTLKYSLLSNTDRPWIMITKHNSAAQWPDNSAS